jgi:hypothetical protein
MLISLPSHAHPAPYEAQVMAGAAKHSPFAAHAALSAKPHTPFGPQSALVVHAVWAPASLPESAVEPPSVHAPA